MSTFENINHNIEVQISTLTKIIELYLEYDIDTHDRNELESAHKKLRDVKSDYTMGLIELPTTTHSNYYDEYIKFINRGSFISSLNTIYSVCKKMRDTYETEDEICQLFDKYNQLPTVMDSVQIATSKCDCGQLYSIEAKNSEYVCNSCGRVEKMVGVIFEDDHFFYQEGQRTKHGKYEPSKHCRFWVDRIQAKEVFDIPSGVLEGVKRCIIRDNIWLDNVTCPVIRKYLKELRMTKYNDHIPLIMKKITSREPPQLSDSEIKQIFLYFSRVIQIYSKNKPENKPNCPYHPYFIYKIIEQILPSSERKKGVLSCIHLQSRETLIDNDTIWKKICEEIPDFVYTPTIGG